VTRALTAPLAEDGAGTGVPLRAGLGGAAIAARLMQFPVD
jgi:hypothetical protein